MQKQKQNNFLYIAAALVCYIALVFATQYVYLTAVLFMIPVVYALARYGYLAGFMLWLVGVALTYLFLGNSALLFGTMALPFVAVTGTMIFKKCSAWSTLIGACGAALCSIGILLGYLYYLSDGDINEYLITAIQTGIKNNEGLAAGFYSIVQQDAAVSLSFDSLLSLPSVGEMRAFLLSSAGMAEVKLLVSYYVPQLIVAFIIYGGLCGFYMPRALAKRSGGAVASVPKIEQMALPKQHGNYLLGLLLIVFIPIVFEIQSLIVPADMIYSLVSMIFAVQGFSLVVYFMNQWIKNKAGCTVLSVFVYLLFPFLVTLAGILDHLMQFRKIQIGV